MKEVMIQNVFYSKIIWRKKYRDHKKFEKADMIWLGKKKKIYVFKVWRKCEQKNAIKRKKTKRLSMLEHFFIKYWYFILKKNNICFIFSCFVHI